MFIKTDKIERYKSKEQAAIFLTWFKHFPTKMAKATQIYVILLFFRFTVNHIRKPVFFCGHFYFFANTNSSVDARRLRLSML